MGLEVKIRSTKIFTWSNSADDNSSPLDLLPAHELNGARFSLLDLVESPRSSDPARTSGLSNKMKRQKERAKQAHTDRPVIPVEKWVKKNWGFFTLIFCMCFLHCSTVTFFEELTMTDQTKISFPETLCSEDLQRSTNKETWLYVTLSHHFTLIENLHLFFVRSLKLFRNEFHFTNIFGANAKHLLGG